MEQSPVPSVTPTDKIELTDGRPKTTQVVAQSEFGPKTKKQKTHRFNKLQPGRRGGASYTKDPHRPSITTASRLSYFPIFTSNQGCRELVSTCYLYIQRRDRRLADAITLEQLTYVTCLAFYNRIVQCALHYGYAFPAEASRLKQYTMGIQLPVPLATYIESVGMFELSPGLHVVPYVDDYHRLVSNDQMLDPAHFLPEGMHATGDWAIVGDWIVDYNASTTRGYKSGMKFRAVDNSQLVGRCESVVSYTEIFDGTLLPTAPIRMSEAEIQLGALYRFRDYTQRERWLGVNKELLFNAFTAIPFEHRVVFSDLCGAAFQLHSTHS